jgi:hypothetical protein
MACIRAFAADGDGAQATFVTVDLKEFHREPAQKVGEQDGEDSHFGFVAVMTPEHSSVNVHGIPRSGEHRARTSRPAIAPESR